MEKRKLYRVVRTINDIRDINNDETLVLKTYDIIKLNDDYAIIKLDSGKKLSIDIEDINEYAFAFNSESLAVEMFICLSTMNNNIFSSKLKSMINENRDQILINKLKNHIDMMDYIINDANNIANSL